MNSNGKQPLLEVEKILKNYRQVLENAAETIRAQDVSNYPIFVVARQEVEIGIPLLKQGQLLNDWIVNASTLEEFHAKRLISDDKIDDFRQLYRVNIEKICLFAFITEGGANFIFF